MLREELIDLLEALPAGADVGIQFGDDHVGIADVVAWGDGDLFAVRSDPTDHRDLLAERAAPDGAGARG